MLCVNKAGSIDSGSSDITVRIYPKDEIEVKQNMTQHSVHRRETGPITLVTRVHG